MTIWNQALCDANTEAVAAGTDLLALQAAFERLLDASRKNADDMRAIEFPGDAQPIADELIANTATFGAILAAFVAAPDVAAANPLLDQAYEVNTAGSGIANRLRGELGVPDVSGDACIS